MVGIKLSVEEACSGIRSLVAILFMCVLYNYFFVERPAMRLCFWCWRFRSRFSETRSASWPPAWPANTIRPWSAARRMKLSAMSAWWSRRLGVVALHLMLQSIAKAWRVIMPKSKSFGSARLGLFVAACLILVLQASASRMLKSMNKRSAFQGCMIFPAQLGPWQATGEQSMDPDVTAYLKPDAYILRDYVGSTEWQRYRPVRGLFQVAAKRLRSALPQDLFAGIGLADQFVEGCQHPRAWPPRRHSSEPIHDGESQPTHPGSCIGIKMTGMCGPRNFRRNCACCRI